ncbi:MAG TPA: hypothetical protein VGH28_16015 [Polyangiaceae bacterium]|jgi:hypothetical protein
MRPGDHPDFFRLPPPPGRSRESTIRLDAEGRFFHENDRVEHPGLEAAMHTWIARHPDDGRFILTNGYDWTYFTVEDTPFFVRGVRVEPDRVVLRLSDGTEEPWNARDTKFAPNFEGPRVTTHVKDGAFEARFDRHALLALGEVLEERGGRMVARVGRDLIALDA